MSYTSYNNAIKRNSKRLKLLIKYDYEIEKEIDNMQDRINKIKWTNETSIDRIRLYKTLGKNIGLFKNNRIRINGLKREFLNRNITG